MTRGRWKASIRLPEATEHRRALDTLAELAGHPALYDEPAPRRRSRPVQHEREHQSALKLAAESRWWGPGFRHHPQEADSRAERLRSWRGGMVAGWPDCTLIIPRAGKVGQHLPRHAALELKRPSVGPRRGGKLDASGIEPDWWLTWLRGLDPRDPLDSSAPRSHYGLRENQAATLRDLYLAGWQVSVCWGWEPALAWLDEVAGDRPSQLPEGWE